MIETVLGKPYKSYGNDDQQKPSVSFSQHCEARLMMSSACSEMQGESASPHGEVIVVVPAMLNIQAREELRRRWSDLPFWSPALILGGFQVIEFSIM
jgi:hypothetical protein